MSTPDLPKAYDPKTAEARWYPLWLERRYFHAPDRPENPYCIVIPPPNVTGALHLGHALNNTLQDILIRLRRMQGFDALWMPGTDHAGIATQAVVERRLFEQHKQTRHDLGRDALVQRIWAWKDDYESRILSQLRLMGCSCDWDRTRFTLDETCSRAVRRTFFNLFKAGKIFRGKRLVNWDTQLRTAVADDEIYTEEVNGHIWTFRYPVVGSDEALHVATTRPETMLGDTAVAVHPEDPRYKHLIGREVALPLTNRTIPIIADGILVDPAFGTGCVKVTPAHDPNDYAAGVRNHLPMINLLNPDGTYNENAGPPYTGLDRMAVRKKVIEELKEQGLLERTDSHLVPLKHSDRSKSPIEPYLSDQWFVRMADDPDGTPGFAQQAIEAVTTGKIRIHPERYAKSYIDWLAEKRDWCISRQLWWGHQIPIWHYDGDPHALEAAFTGVADVHWKPAETGGYLVCFENDAVLENAPPNFLQSAQLERDPDVLDTWFSSALWPHSTLGWPEQTPELQGYYPTAVLSTARDIITLWVARMVIFGQFNVGDVPFRDVFIHPVIQDGDGKRMSKSAGNGIDPVDIIEAYGADALRYTLAAATTETQDLRIPVEPVKNDAGEFALRTTYGQPTNWVPQEVWKKSPRDQRVNTSERFEQGRTFPNKFWNSARFAIMNLDGHSPRPVASDDLTIEDRWILSRLDAAIIDTTAHLDSFRFADATRTLRDFTWNDFCDWYLELIKPRLRDESARPVARQVLATVLDNLCRLLHPIMPFVTEEAWQALNAVAPQRGLAEPWGDPAPSVCIAAWPRGQRDRHDPMAESTIGHWQEKIAALRNLRAERGVPEKARINPIIIANGPAAEALRVGESHIRSLTAADSITIVSQLDQRPDQSAATVLPDCEVILPLAGLIDIEAERSRLRKQLGDLERQLQALRSKLGNESFVSRAPAEVVAQTRTRVEELATQYSAVQSLIAALP